MTGSSNMPIDGVESNGIGLSNGAPIEPKTMPLAIVGMACRFAGGITDPEGLWELVSRGRDAWSEIPDSRFKQKAFYHPDSTRVSTVHTKGGYFLDQDVGLFDLSFFNMSADLAAAMDPQLRMQLEVTFEAFENAGMPLSKVMGSNTCVFAGAFTRDYKDISGRDPLFMSSSFVPGTYATMLAARVSHFFDLRGHSTAIDTACSTSLMGLHLACQSLRAGDSDAAVIGGACLHLSPDSFSGISTLGTLGPNGKCYAFDHRAEGYGRGEGVAALVVKRLEDAIRDGDPIRAVIRETGANQDGRTPTITTPDAEAQKRLIQQCYSLAGLDPLETNMFEAHGTGTSVGDPIEAKAVGQTLGANRPLSKPVYMASVKTNIGHTEATSGLASLIKIAMSFQHKQIAPHINFEKINPDIDLRNLSLQIPSSLQHWPSSGVRRASVNNFGFGGTNTHVILEEPGFLGPPLNSNVARVQRPDHQLFILSARDKVAANTMIVNLRQHVEKEIDRYENALSFAELAYTLCERRSRFPWTATLTASSAQDLVDNLKDNSIKPSQSTSTAPRLGFVFNGQGAQWFGMGRELESAYPIYAETLQDCDKILKSFGAQWSLIEELRRDNKTSRVHDVQFSMPLSCAVQLALVELLRGMAIEPSVVTGHSSGEVAAAFAAGALSLREAMACTYFRGRINSEHISHRENVTGGMMAVGLSSVEVQPYLEVVRSGKVVIACVNSPSSVTLAGDIAGIKELEARFNKEDVFARALRVQAAFHSHHMLPLESEYLAALNQHMETCSKKAFRENVLFMTPVTGNQVNDANELGPQHWVQNMIKPVLFAQSFQSMVVGQAGQQQVDLIIEIGPHGALSGPIRQNLKEVPSMQAFTIPYGSCLQRHENAVKTIQNLAGFVLEKGYPVNTCRVNSPNGMSELRALKSLPPYPWNHTNRFWHQSRMSVEYNKREHPPHQLLGTRSPGTSDKAPIWRHFIRTLELPWVRDHMIQGDIVYPGAAYITMAIEAIRQVHASETIISGFRLTEVEILKAVVIPDTKEGVEIQLFLEPTNEKTMDHDKRQFRIYSSLGESRWEETARGFIVAMANEEARNSALLPSTSRIDFNGDFQRKIPSKEFYASLHNFGVEHGPIFQDLQNIQGGEQSSCATFQIHDMNALLPYKFGQPHVIDPISLDQIFQAAYATLSPEAGNLVGTAVPRFIRSMYISAGLDFEPGVQLKIFSNLLRHSGQGFQTSSAVLLDQQGSDDKSASSIPVIELDGLRFQSIGRSADADDNTEALNDICAFVDYESSFSLNDPIPFFERLQRPVDSEEKRIGQDLVRASYHLITDTVKLLTEEEKETLSLHHQQLYMWMNLQLEKATTNELAPNSSNWVKISPGAKAMLLDRVAGSGANGALLIRVGRSLAKILRREVDPLEIMLEGGLLNNFYKEMLHYNASIAQLAEIAAAYCQENPRARILEIGGGTGSCTEPVLKALISNDTQAAGFHHYTFTDISSEFFQAASERFGAWGKRITYAQLDIGKDPIGQAFSEESYDLVIAAQVLHSTKDIDAAMRNVRKLLKDSGRLLMIETTKDWSAQNLIFGTLPSWWSSKESERTMSPNLQLKSWQHVLKTTGFSGVDASVWDCQDEQHQASSVILSTAVQQNPSVLHHKMAIVYDNASSPPENWLNNLSKCITGIEGMTTIIGKAEEIDVKGRVCIFVSRLDGIPYNIDASNFEIIKSLITKCKDFVWVTSGATIECPIPENALSLGFLRTCRAEYASRRFVSLDLDPERPHWDITAHEIVSRVLAAVFNSSLDTPKDYEFTERKGKLLVPRVRRDDAENATFVNMVRETEMQPFIHPDGRQLKLEVAFPGQLDSVIFRDNVESGKLQDDWVEIEPHAFGLNFRDVMGAMGQLDEAQQLGSECAGIVVDVGSDAGKLKVGDRVAGVIYHGRIASRVRVPWTSVASIGNKMPFSEAASIPVAFVTAYYSLFEAARLSPGETVLIHAASGGVGQACIILAQWKKLDIFATVGTQQKREFIKETYGIPDNRIFSSRDTSFAPAVLAATDHRGVDAIINSLAGSLLHESLGVLASHGKFVEIGKRNIHSNMALELEVFRKAVTFSAFDLVQLAKNQGQIVQPLLVKVLDLIENKTVRNIAPIVTYPMAGFSRALRSMQKGEHIGKLVIVPESGDMVKTVPLKASAKLQHDATYLIVGGLGGVGRSLSRWLVDHGAKNIVLISRSAASSPHAKALEKDTAVLGVTVIPMNCDISSLEDLRSVVRECGKAMPPIRGIIHSGMVIKDSILEIMTASQWNDVLAPKLAGTKNLDLLFSAPSSLDFFIILSSVVGMAGNPSQAHYGAGGAFQDAVARSRSSRVLPCVTIDLGVMNGVGYVAEDKGLSGKLLSKGLFRPIEETELHQLIDYAVRIPIRPIRTAQIVTGIAGKAVREQDVGWACEMRFAPLAGEEELRSTQRDVGLVGGSATANLRQRFKNAQSIEDAAELLEKAIISKLADIFAIPEEEIEASQPLSKYGVDSLVAVELRNWLVSNTQCDMSIFDILDAKSSSQLSNSLAKRSKESNGL